MTDDEQWEKDSRDFGWEMPRAAWWKRLPVIRRFRAAFAAAHVNQHNAFWTSLGSIPSGYDRWVVYGIATGKERPSHD